MLVTSDREAHDYISAVVAVADGEIGGIGYIKLIEPGHFHISRFVLLEQEASHASVDFEGEAYLEEIMSAGEANRENELRLSWHSHGDMDVYWSNIDESGITEYKSLGMPWLVSLVFNKDGEVEARLDIFDHETCDHIKMKELDYEPDPDPKWTQLVEDVKEEVKAVIKAPKKWTYGNSYNPNKPDSGDKPKEDISPRAYGFNENNEIPEMPAYLERADFIDDTCRAILVMEYGHKAVDEWEDQMFDIDEDGFIIIDGEASEEDELERSLPYECS